MMQSYVYIQKEITPNGYINNGFKIYFYSIFIK